MKRGQGLSMETIILAVLALIILVVLVLIFTGKMNVFSKQSASCATHGGQCQAKDQSCSIPGVGYTCDGNDMRCCLSP